MYTSKESINILTALLVKHGVQHAVVCPGSRNAAIVHNLNACPDITCYPVTDERSAGFYALGLTQALQQPVVVCVTSGTALLNLAPAVAEAYYQQRPLVVVSADRPPQWIDQHDGQTLPQSDALGRFVVKAVTLPEVSASDAEERWYCNRLVNEALLAVKAHSGNPVHINVPVSEPLFRFDVAELPDERVIRQTVWRAAHSDLCMAGGLVEAFWKAKRPMVIIGQTDGLLPDRSCLLYQHAVVLHEVLSGDAGAELFDDVLRIAADDSLLCPDFVLYGGGTLVSKRLKAFLRNVSQAEFWEVSSGGQLHDTFMHATGVVESDIVAVVRQLNDFLDDDAADNSFYADTLGTIADTSAFVGRWKALLAVARSHVKRFSPSYSQMAAVKCFECRVAMLAQRPFIHYGNSMAVRLANIYSRGFVYCNRGVNGIEGSLSAAAGFSLAVPHTMVCCVLGDLSFFYDQNALWNRNLSGNLRILLLNNAGGGIFRQLPGLESSPALDELVAACHQTSAEGICQQNDVYYQQATNMEELKRGIELLLTAELSRPMLLEVFTDSEADNSVFREYCQPETNKML